MLSFKLSEEDSEFLEGEVYVNTLQAKRQAKEYGVSAGNETGRLMVHGVLHLLGYDDRTPAERNKMKRREDYFLKNYGVKNFHA